MHWVFIFLVLSGCAPNYANKTATEVRSAVKVKQTAFDPQRQFTGPPIVLHNRYANDWAWGISESITAHLRSWQDPDHPEITTHQLYTSVVYQAGWRFYISANFKGGAGAQFSKIDSDVSCSKDGCSYSEDFGVAVSHDFLEKHRTTGFEIQANAKSSHKTVIAIPANYVEGYLAIAGQATNSALAAERQRTPRQRATTAYRAPDTRESRLLELKRLRSENLITPDEYYQKRSEILGEL